MPQVLRRFAALLSAALVASPGAASAADPVGLWLTEDGNAKVRISPCGGAICGNIVWLRQPNDGNGKPKLDKSNADAGKRGRPLLGVPIVLAMKPDGTSKWSGQVYNAEDGKTYSGSFALLDANRAALKGCFAIICKTNNWTRTR
jgi:uncharacterized protein (DUF2147 family)